MTFRMMRVEAICNLADKRDERIGNAIRKGIQTLLDAGLLILANNVLKDETLRIIGIAGAGLRGIRNAGGFVFNTYWAIRDTKALKKAFEQEEKIGRVI